jgi:LysM repeat protein
MRQVNSMAVIGKIGIAGGHGNGQNQIPMPWKDDKPAYMNYAEGTAMFNLAAAVCKAFPQVFNGRTETSDPSFVTRADRFKKAKCEFAFELHTNWSLNSRTRQPNRGVFLVIVTLHLEAGKLGRTAQKAACDAEIALATRLWKPLADDMGLKFEVRTRKSNIGNWDYYGFIRENRKRGVAHPMIVEHGYHVDFAEDIPGNTTKVIAHYAALLGVAVPGTAQPPKPPVTPPQAKPANPVLEAVYTVKRGDTPVEIARVFGITAELLMSRNGIEDPRALQIGDKLYIPRTDVISYVVQPGDTLSKISGPPYNVAWEDIARMNGITDPTTLRAGRTIYIPVKK